MLTFIDALKKASWGSGHMEIWCCDPVDDKSSFKATFFDPEQREERTVRFVVDETTGAIEEIEDGECK